MFMKPKGTNIRSQYARGTDCRNSAQLLPVLRVRPRYAKVSDVTYLLMVDKLPPDGRDAVKEYSRCNCNANLRIHEG
jgi:hypothetical protein